MIVAGRFKFQFVVLTLSNHVSAALQSCVPVDVVLWNPWIAKSQVTDDNCCHVSCRVLPLLLCTLAHSTVTPDML